MDSYNIHNNNNKCWRNWNPYIVLGMQSPVATMEVSMEDPQKLKRELQYYLPISSDGIHQEESKPGSERDLFISILITKLFTITK
jgi:hypothetical protein